MWIAAQHVWVQWPNQVYSHLYTHFPLYLLLQCTSCSSSKHQLPQMCPTLFMTVYLLLKLQSLCCLLIFCCCLFVFWRPNAIILLGCWELLTTEISGHWHQLNYYLIVRLCLSVSFLEKPEVNISGSVPCRPNKCNKCRPFQMTSDTFQWLEL